MAATSFSPSMLSSKLRELQNTIHSIQTLSLWIIQHRKHARTVTGIWLKEFMRLPSSQQLTLMYLCNDVIQNSKRKGPEYTQEYEKILPKAIKAVHNSRDSRMKKASHRILNVWEERNVFDELFINELRLTLGEDTGKTEEFEAKKRKIEEVISLEEPPSVEPPEAEKLVKLVNKVFDDDRETRSTEAMKNISELQRTVLGCTDVAGMKDEEDVEKLLKSTTDLIQLVSEQCSHLSDSVSDEEQLTSLLTASIHHNKDELQVSHQNMEETRQKLERVHVLKEDLQVHLAKLPDLSKLAPQGVAPLPAIGDLFN